MASNWRDREPMVAWRRKGGPVTPGAPGSGLCVMGCLWPIDDSVSMRFCTQCARAYLRQVEAQGGATVLRFPGGEIQP